MKNDQLARKVLVQPGMLLAVCGMAIAVGWAPPAAAQDSPSSAVANAEIAEAEDDVEDKYRRLPPYYGEVVTEAQKKTIYEIQQTYAEQIEELKAELRKVIRQRDAEIEQLLTAEQRQKVEQIAADRQEELEVLRKFREQRAKERAGASAAN